MNIRIPEGKSRLMLVEGKEDQEFFIKLAIVILMRIDKRAYFQLVSL